jgi:ABC-2 type transport system ATP-binding protein
VNKVLLQIKNLAKHFYNKNEVKKALDGITLDIFQGEVIGLLGVNGAGKTTLSTLLASLKPPTSGDILLDGKSIYEDINTYRYNVGFCQQAPNLSEDLTVEEILYFAARYFGMNKEEAKNRTEEILSKHKLEEYRKSNPSSLSGGYKHRVMIARSLIHYPKLLILDEPTVGLDPHIRHQLWEQIRELRNDNVTVILTTHYLDEAEILSDRICMLDQGKIKLVDTPENLKSIYKKSTLEAVFMQLMHEEPLID